MLKLKWLTKGLKLQITLFFLNIYIFSYSTFPEKGKELTARFSRPAQLVLSSAPFWPVSQLAKPFWSNPEIFSSYFRNFHFWFLGCFSFIALWGESFYLEPTNLVELGCVLTPILFTLSTVKSFKNNGFVLKHNVGNCFWIIQQYL